MKIITYSALVLCVFSSGLQAVEEAVFIPGLSQEQIDQSNRKAIDAANAAINSQEPNAQTTLDSKLPYQHKENYRLPPINSRPAYQSYGAPSPQWNGTQTYTAPAMPQYNSPYNNFGGTGSFSGSNIVPAMPTAPAPIPTPR